MHDYFKITNGLPIIGQKIKFIKNSHIWFTDVMERTKQLKVGYDYTVTNVEVASSASYVYIEEFEGMFSLGSFEWELPPLNLDALVGMDVFQTYGINRVYGYGIERQGHILVDGSPILVIESEVTDTAPRRNYVRHVTKAYFK